MSVSEIRPAGTPSMTPSAAEPAERQQGASALVAPAYAFELAYVGPGSEAFLTEPDLGPLVRRLKPDEKLSIAYAVDRDGDCKIVLRFYSDADDAEAAFGCADWERAAQSLAQGFAVQKTNATALPSSPVSLRRAAQPLFYSGGHERGDLGLAVVGGTTAEIEGRVLAPVANPAALDVPSALKVLLADGGAFCLEVVASRVKLSAVDFRSIMRVYREEKSALPTPFEDPARYGRGAHMLEFLSSWQERRLGTSIECRLALPDAQTAFSDVIADILFCGDAANSCRVECVGAELDLSQACVDGAPLPSILPAAAKLERIGFVGGGSSASHGPVDEPPFAQTLAGRGVSLSDADRGRHIAIVGATGVGKSHLMGQMIAADIAQSKPTVLIDTVGDLCEQTKSKLTPEECERVVDADVSGRHGHFGLDLLSNGGGDRGREVSFVCTQLVSVFKRVLYRDQPEGLGPVFEQYFSMGLSLLLLSDYDGPGLVDLDRVFGDAKFRRSLVESCTDEVVKRYWRDIAAKAGGDLSIENVAPYIVAKLQRFCGNALVRSIISGEHPALDFVDILDTGKSLFVNLAKGECGEADASLLGALFTIRLFATLQARASLPEHERPVVRIFMDEYQTFATDALGHMLAESRKFGSQMTLATQSIAAINSAWRQPGVADSILSNCGNLLCFRTGPRDARILSDWFQPGFDPARLTRLPDRTFTARLMQDGVPMPPVMLQAAP